MKNSLSQFSGVNKTTLEMESQNKYFNANQLKFPSFDFFS